MKRLIVNADDLGWTPGVNEGVFESHLSGIVSSATLMVNAPGAEHAAQNVRRPELAGLGVGLHVALSGGGRPTLPPGKIPSLVDDQGRLPRRPEGLEGADAVEILAEVRAQFRRFEELVGRPPTHLDGHHHVHRRPAVCDAVITIATEGAARLPVRNAAPEVLERLGRAAVATTDSFDERFYGEEATFELLSGILLDLEPGVTEVMCHPARVDPELRKSSTYVDEREAELAVLTDPELRRILAARAIQLVDFRAL